MHHIFFRMASSNVISITDVLIDFQSGRMFCTLPKGTLEVAILTNSDWGQANVIEDETLKTNISKP